MKKLTVKKLKHAMEHVGVELVLNDQKSLYGKYNIARNTLVSNPKLLKALAMYINAVVEE